jgi:hypothetical protein
MHSTDLFLFYHVRKNKCKGILKKILGEEGNLVTAQIGLAKLFSNDFHLSKFRGYFVVFIIPDL